MGKLISMYNNLLLYIATYSDVLLKHFWRTVCGGSYEGGRHAGLDCACEQQRVDTRGAFDHNVQLAKGCARSLYAPARRGARTTQGLLTINRTLIVHVLTVQRV